MSWVHFEKLCSESLREERKRNQTKPQETSSKFTMRFISYLILIIYVKASEQAQRIRCFSIWIIWKFKLQWVWTVKCCCLFIYTSVCLVVSCARILVFFISYFHLRVCVCVLKVQSAFWIIQTGTEYPIKIAFLTGRKLSSRSKSITPGLHFKPLGSCLVLTMV